MNVKTVASILLGCTLVQGMKIEDTANENSEKNPEAKMLDRVRAKTNSEKPIEEADKEYRKKRKTYPPPGPRRCFEHGDCVVRYGKCKRDSDCCSDVCFAPTCVGNRKLANKNSEMNQRDLKEAASYQVLEKSKKVASKKQEARSRKKRARAAWVTVDHGKNTPCRINGQCVKTGGWCEFSSDCCSEFCWWQHFCVGSELAKFLDRLNARKNLEVAVSIRQREL